MILVSELDPRSEAFKANDEVMRGHVADLRRQVETIREGGGEKAKEKHLSRGNSLPREVCRS